MSGNQVFTVFGATGQQGGAVVKYILQHPVYSSVYRLRGVTRGASKPAAKALSEQGVEVVEVLYLTICTSPLFFPCLMCTWYAGRLE